MCSGPKAEWFAGLLFNAVEVVDQAELVQDFGNVVLLAHGDTACDDDDIALLNDFRELLLGGFTVVGQVNAVAGVDLVAGEGGFDGNVVGAADLMSLGFEVDVDEFVTSADECNGRHFRDVECVASTGGGDGNFAATEDATRAEEFGAFTVIAAGGVNAIAGGVVAGGFELDTSVVGLGGDFVRHDAICVLGDDGSGHDFNTAAELGAELHGRCSSRGLSGDSKGLDLVSFCCADCVAIHHGAIEGRQRTIRGYELAQDAACAFADRAMNGRECWQMGIDVCLGFVGGNKRFHRISRA